METPEFSQDRQQIKRGEFIGGHHQLAFLQFAELDQSLARIQPQIEQLFGILLEDASGIGQRAVARRAVEQGLSDLDFEFADRLTDGRLGAKKLLSGARKSALTGYGKEDFQLGKVHEAVLNSWFEFSRGKPCNQFHCL